HHTDAAAATADRFRKPGNDGLRRHPDGRDYFHAPWPGAGSVAPAATDQVMSLLQTTHLTKAFGGVEAVSDLSFAVEAGHVHSIIGPNGAGKTTLVNLLTGIYTPTSGRIEVNGQDTNGIKPHDLAKLGI